MAAVMRIAQYRLTPGREAEFYGICAESKKALEAIGAKVRVWNMQIAGADSGTIVISTEYADTTAFGTAMDTVAADPGFVPPAARFAASGTATLVTGSLSVEVMA